MDPVRHAEQRWDEAEHVVVTIHLSSQVTAHLVEGWNGPLVFSSINILMKTGDNLLDVHEVLERAPTIYAHSKGSTPTISC